MSTTGLNSSLTPLPSSLLNDYNEDKLVGNYNLQIVCIKDISTAPNAQESEFLRIDEEPAEGDEDEPLKGKKGKAKPSEKKKDNKERHKGPRLICLTLSDGTNVVKAIEYKPIPHLKPDLPIGTRIRVKGPVEVSFKVLLLKGSNIELLGPPPSGDSTALNLPDISLTSSISQMSTIPAQSTSARSSTENVDTSSLLVSNNNQSIILTPNSLSTKPVLQEVNQSIVEISSSIDGDDDDQNMYFLDDLDDEILE